MYELHFALRDRPFRLNPDPDVLFWSEPHREVARFLSEAGERPARPGKDVYVLTGEIGAGKTTLILNFLAKRPPGLTIGLVSNLIPHCEDLLPWLARALPTQDDTGTGPRSAILTGLRAEQAAGRAMLFVIDEAQELAPPALELLRDLLETAQEAGLANLRVLLAGQPELARHLIQPENVAFGARIARMAHLPCLSAEDTHAYVRHRLTAAGAASGLFTKGAVDLMHRRAAGIPRLVNLIADQALMTAYHAGRDQIDEPLLEQSLAQSPAPLLREGPVMAMTPQAPPTGVPKPQGTSPFDGGLKEKIRARALVEESPATAPTAPHDDAASVTGPAMPIVYAPPAPPAMSVAQPSWQPLPDERHRPKPRGTRWLGLLMLAGLAWAGGWWWFDRTDLPLPMTPTLTPAAVSPEPPVTASPAAAPVRAATPRPSPAAVSAPTAPVPGPESVARTRGLLDGAAPEVLLREAARLAVDDPAAGAMGFMLAALAGSDQAAAFVADMAETGDGLPANDDLARLWRGETVDPTRPVATPVPLLARRAGADRGDLIWATGPGAPRYLIEVRSAAGTMLAAAESRLGAMRIRMPVGAAEWRVTALSPTGPGAGALASDWLPLALAP